MAAASSNTTFANAGFDGPDFLLRLLRTPSPTGLTRAALELVAQEVQSFGVTPRFTPKGALLWTLPGATQGAGRALAAHVDTLGAMVKRIKPNGRLVLSMLGGYDWGSVEGEYALVHGANGAVVSGTVVNVLQSVHVHGKKSKNPPRNAETLELRLDALGANGGPIANASDVAALGVGVGDFVSWDARAEHLPNGYIKSRHLDNKAGVAILLAVTRALLRVALPQDLHCFVSNYEEVGHGAAHGIPGVQELVAIDMAAVGEGQTSSEHHCSLCVKDSSGPYDHELGLALRRVAARAGVDLKIDIYPHYASDASAAWRAGGAFRAALVGPGVDASHAYERTHVDALEATTKLLVAYAQS